MRFSEVTALKKKPPFKSAVCLITLLVLFNGPTIGNALAAQSECIRCHTKLKSLIRLCWAVEKIKPRPPQSAETSGEG